MPNPRKGRPYRRARQQMFDMFGRVCHICGHDGATDADHVTPLAADPRQPVSPLNLRPAHGVRGCPTCGKACNQARGAKPIAKLLRTSRPW